VRSESGTVRLNRTAQDGNDTLGLRAMSTLTLLEVVG
jgi:hypothetical protein